MAKEGGKKKGQDSLEQHSKSPNLQIQRRSQELAQRERLRLSILTVAVDTAHNESAFTLGKETPRLVRAVGEVHHKDEAGDANAACQDALHDEDPAPSRDTGEAVHLGEGQA